MQNKQDSANERHWLMRAFDQAADVAGASAGAAVGASIAGNDPVLAAAVGVGFAQAIKSVGAEIEERWLAPRERLRLSTSAKLIVMKIKTNYDRGKRPRADAFFQPTNDDRSAAEEIFEATMLAIQRDAQEKKSQLYSNLVANIAFDSTVDRAFANYLVALTERLTYRQLCMLALFGGDVSTLQLHGSYRGYQERLSWDKWSVLQEMYDLCRARLLNNQDASAYIDLADINPSGTVLDGVANKMFQLM